MSEYIVCGNIMTMAGGDPRAGAFAVAAGCIQAVGTPEEVYALMPPGTEVKDFGSALITPGLVDTHMHPLTTGISLAGTDLSGAESIGDVLEALRRQVEAVPRGEWIIGTRFQDKRTVERRFPTLKELDDLTVDHSVMVQHNDVHFLQLNTAGLGRLRRDTGGTGYFEDPEALDIIEHFQNNLPREKKMEYMRNVCDLAACRGLTELHVKEIWENLEVLLSVEDSLPVRLKPLVFVLGLDDPGIDAVLENPGLRGRAVLCLINDGTLDGHTAALLEPYTDLPECRAHPLFSDADLERFMGKAFKAGVQISIHAVGDGAIEQIIRTAEKLLPGCPGLDHRLRIEHFEMPAPGQIERAARLGITAGVQPMLIPVCQGMDFSGYRPFVGERVLRANTFKSYITAGMLIAGGSDSPVTPLDPFQGITAAMNHPTEAERLTFYEALSLYTLNASRIAFEENTGGTLEPGKRADFTVIDCNPEAGNGLPGADDVLAVFVGGRCVHGSD